MCGIAGFIDTKISNNERDALLESMLESIAHRGPDFRGKWINDAVALGHNRLSIIDLSDEGNQPMHYDGASIIFNGEIYNYLEIKNELTAKGYRFHSHSDTEVILASYKEWGKDCVQKFLGMWAFAIWDEEKKELFCSRDRFGIKPFYYLFENGRFYFGSEYKAIKKSPCFKNDLNLTQVARGLQLGWNCYHDETYFEKIKSLPEAHSMIYKNGEIIINRYWTLLSKENSILNFEERKYKFRELLRDVTKIHMRSDVEIAVCLSGGIDSSSLTALIAEVFPDQKFNSFSIYYDGLNEVDERPFMNTVINKYPQVNPYFYKPEESSVQDMFHDVVDKSDIPITGSSPISHYYLVKKIRATGIKVVLDGQGADEYLAGYIPSFYRRMADLISDFKGGSLLNMLKHLKNDQQLSITQLTQSLGKGLLSSIMSEQQLYNTEYKNYYPFLVRKEILVNDAFELKSFGDNKLDNYLYHSLFATSLPTILHYVDRMTMASSIESRVPFLDHRLIEFAFTLPTNDKLNVTQTKSILRESLRDILPSEIYHRKDKKGFVTPGEGKWLRGHLSWLLESDFNKLEFLDLKLVKGVVSDYKNGNNKNARLVWRVALLNYWLNKQ